MKLNRFTLSILATNFLFSALTPNAHAITSSERVNNNQLCRGAIIYDLNANFKGEVITVDDSGTITYANLEISGNKGITTINSIQILDNSMCSPTDNMSCNNISAVGTSYYDARNFCEVVLKGVVGDCRPYGGGSDKWTCSCYKCD